MGKIEADPEVVSAAFGRTGNHDPERLNAIANAVTQVLGFTVLSKRYAIAVMALEALEQATPSTKGTD